MTLELFEFVWLTVLRTRTSWYILCWWLTPGRSSCLGLGLWSWREFPPVGVTWWSKRLFSFSGLSGFSVPITQSDDRRSSARVVTFKPPWGLVHSPVIWGDTGWLCRMTWQKPRPSSRRLEGLGWAHDAWAVPSTLWPSPSPVQGG